MKRNRNSHSGFGLPLFISFNELAWLAVVGVVLIAAPQLAKGKQQRSNSQEEKKQPQEPEPTLTEEDKLRRQLKEAEQGLAKAKDQLEEADQKLENKNADTTFRHAELIRKIGTLEKQLKETKQEFIDAKSKNTELPAKIDALEKQLKSMEQERDLALAEERKLRNQLKEAEQELAQAQNQLEETKQKLEDKNVDATFRHAELIRKIGTLEKQLKETKQELEVAESKKENREQVVRKELLGLEGELEYVGILLDRSSSMKKGNRWEDSIQIVKTWLQHLPIENCFLITYNHEFNTFPANLYLPVSGPNRERNRKQLIQHIQDVQPDGGTHTIEALAKAYKDPKLQTIILFTDGEPKLWDENLQGLRPQNKADKSIYQTGRSVSRNMKEILQLCRNKKQSRRVTVNVVAIGDYFEEKFGEFLRNVAKETGGAFIGR